RGLEVGSAGFEPHVDLNAPGAMEQIRRDLTTPGASRIWYVADAFRAGMTLEEVHESSAIDPWFLVQIEDLVKTEQSLVGRKLTSLTQDELYRLKRKGFSDQRIADLMGQS